MWAIQLQALAATGSVAKRGRNKGCVAKFFLRHGGFRDRPLSCRQYGELLGQGEIWIERIPCLSLAHHVKHFDPGQDDAGGGRRLEGQHQPHTALDAPVVLLDPVVQVSTFPDRDRFQPASGTILQSICHIAGSDGFVIGLAAVDDDAIGPAEAVQRFPEEALSRRRSRCSLNQNSTVSPTLSMAR